MKHFIFLAAVIFFLVFSYGFIAPTLISYPDTTVVLGGIVFAAVVAPAMVYVAVSSYVKMIYNKLKGNDQ